MQQEHGKTNPFLSSPVADSASAVASAGAGQTSDVADLFGSAATEHAATAQVIAKYFSCLKFLS